MRAYLNAEGLEREEKLLEGLSNAALALSQSMDAATAKERASTALLLRSVAARVGAATVTGPRRTKRVGSLRARDGDGGGEAAA